MRRRLVPSLVRFIVSLVLVTLLASCGSGGSSGHNAGDARQTAGTGISAMGPGMMATGGAARMMGRGSGVPPPTVTIAPTVAPGGDAPVSFSRDVLPILTSQCGSCHGGQGGLWLTTFEQVMVGGESGPVVVPDQPGRSLLYLRVTGQQTPQMPLDSPPLSQNQIDAIKGWIAEGAPKN